MPVSVIPGSFASPAAVLHIMMQTVTLHKNGSFSATLAHETKTGTYTEAEVDGVITVAFGSNEKSVEGSIENEILTIPDEWQDDHGHGSKLKLT